MKRSQVKGDYFLKIYMWLYCDTPVVCSVNLEHIIIYIVTVFYLFFFFLLIWESGKFCNFQTLSGFLTNKNLFYRMENLHLILVFKPVKFATLTWKCIKLYLTTFSNRESQSIKICYINVHLNIDLFTFNKYCIITQIIVHDCYTE